MGEEGRGILERIDETMGEGGGMRNKSMCEVGCAAVYYVIFVYLDIS